MGVVFALPAEAQRKVKYKDLYPILQQQQWDQAEPFLKQFMGQDPDFPNANLQMGLLYDYKARQMDVLEAADQLKVFVDSAVFFYNRAKVLIDEREVRRRDEYYLAYNRRDLRTGKFGIKISDIQLDLDNKIEALQSLVSRAAEARKLLANLGEHYSATVKNYEQLHDKFGSQRRLSLLADGDTRKALTGLAVDFDTTMAMYSRYSGIMKAIGRDYPTEITVRSIEEFGRDGISTTKFTSESATVWDFKTWATEIERLIEDEIIPLRKRLVDYDAHFSVLYGDFLNGMDISSRLTLDADLMSTLNRIDPQGFPIQLFEYKANELRYYVSERVLTDPSTADTVLIYKELNQTMSVAETLQSVEKAYRALKAIDMDEAAQAYPELIQQRYSNVAGFRDFLTNRQRFLTEERGQLDRYLVEWQKREVEGIWAPDTVIALVMDSVPKPDLTPGAHTLAVEEFKEENFWVGGMFFNPGDKPTAYIAQFGPNHYANWRHQISLESFPEEDSLLALASQVIWKDDKVQYVVFYNENPVGESFPGIVARIDEGELSWHAQVALNRPVVEVKYRQFEEDIKFYLQEMDGQPQGSNYLLVTNTGEIRLPQPAAQGGGNTTGSSGEGK